MKTRSCKAKGRRAAQEVQSLLLIKAPGLWPDDIQVTSSSVTGVDIRLSPAASEVYPFVIEVKNHEKLNIWAALKQCEGHQKKGEDKIPVLFFRRNRSELYVTLKASDFLDHFKGKNK